jgi:hypothetical protein
VMAKNAKRSAKGITAGIAGECCDLSGAARRVFARGTCIR